MDRHVVLVGGGLQNALVALALDAADSDVRVTMIDRAEQLGGNHTWCFFESDLSAQAHAWCAPLVTHRWPRYDVRFPELTRTIETGYARTDGERLNSVVQDLFKRRSSWRLRTGVSVSDDKISAGVMTLSDGSEERFDLAVVATGPRRERSLSGAGFQKFFGAEVLLSQPHGIRWPVVMDAKVEQQDGLRFFYLLPLDERRLLVEDTRFSDASTLNRDALRREVERYMDRAGFRVEKYERLEAGVLPLPYDSHTQDATLSPPPTRLNGGAVVYGGYAGGWFHPITGYSLPLAARLAEAIASGQPLQMRHLFNRVRRQQRIARGLNRVFFRHYAPADRWHLMQRFHRRPTPVIERFYGMQLSWWDLTRILVGPIPKNLKWWPRPTVQSALTSEAA